MNDNRTPDNNEYCSDFKKAVEAIIKADGLRVIKSNSGKVVRAYINDAQFKEGPLAGEGQKTSNQELFTIKSKEGIDYQYKLNLKGLADEMGSEEELQKVIQKAPEFKPLPREILFP